MLAACSAPSRRQCLRLRPIEEVVDQCAPPLTPEQVVSSSGFARSSSASESLLWQVPCKLAQSLTQREGLQRQGSPVLLLLLTPGHTVYTRKQHLDGTDSLVDEGVGTILRTRLRSRVSTIHRHTSCQTRYRPAWSGWAPLGGPPLTLRALLCYVKRLEDGLRSHVPSAVSQ